jgi:glyoxylase I family protein
VLKSIHHVAIICSDYQKSKHFYTVILGLEIIAENYRQNRASYKLDLKLPCGGQIELFSFPSPPIRPNFPEALGLRHLAFSVESVTEVSEYLRSQNIAVEAIRVDEYTGKKFVFFNDPDGLPLELYENTDIQ